MSKRTPIWHDFRCFQEDPYAWAVMDNLQKDVDRAEARLLNLGQTVAASPDPDFSILHQFIEEVSTRERT